MSSKQTFRFGGLSALALAMVLTACGGAGGTLTTAEAHKLVEGGATLLDVRSPGEWQQKHIEGAVLVPVSELDGRMAEIERSKPVVVYCASGGRSARATAALRSAGYDARDLGAMSRWYE